MALSGCGGDGYRLAGLRLGEVGCDLAPFRIGGYLDGIGFGGETCGYLHRSVGHGERRGIRRRVGYFDSFAVVGAHDRPRIEAMALSGCGGDGYRLAGFRFGRVDRDLASFRIGGYFNGIELLLVRRVVVAAPPPMANIATHAIKENFFFI